MRIPLLAVILLSLSAPSFSQSQWRLPQPQGHTLNDIVFLDNNTAIAVGEFGTVMVTHDAGNTWSVQTNVLGATAPFKSIARLDDNSAVAVGPTDVYARTTDQGATWTNGWNTPYTAFHNDVSFFDATHGIAVGQSRVSRTSDGGLTWQVLAILKTFYSVDMISATNAVAVAANSVMYTTNGGASWTAGVSPVPSSPLTFLTSVDFRDALHGAISAALWGQGGSTNPPRCYVTADGGATWTPSDLHNGSTAEEYWPRELLYPASGEILVAGEVRPDFYEAYPSGEFGSTVNSGAQWINQSVNRTAYGLARNNDGVVIIVGQDGRITRRNLDNTYTEFGPTYPHHRSATGRSAFFSAERGIVFTSDGTDTQDGSGDTDFARTTDGGQTWSFSKASGQCLDVAFLSASRLVAVGMDGAMGVVLQSIDGGVSWSQLWTGPSPVAVRSVVATSATRAIAVGSGSDALIIDDGVVSVVPTAGTNFRDVAFAVPSTLMAVGSSGARSTDGGLTWTPIGSSASSIVAIAFVTPTRVVGVDQSGTSSRILVSDETGGTWTPVVSTAPYLNDVSFADDSWGIAVGSNTLIIEGAAGAENSDRAESVAATNGPVYVTTDGGNNWQQIESPTGRPFSAVTAVSPGHAFASNGVADVIEFGEELPTAVRREPSSAALQLLPNQPNPFNPTTTIRFVLPAKSKVTLSVHDVTGRVVATLVDEVRDAGAHNFTWNAQGVASGVYFAKLRAGETEVSRKMVLLK